MPKAYEATLYYNTGFDRGNVPDSPAILAGMTSKNYDAVYLWQDMWAGSVRLNAEFDDVKDADYAKIGDAYYVVDGVSMLSPMTSQLNLIMDPLTTAGGIGALTVLSGWAERAHTANDTIFGNIAPEPWGPTQRMIIRARADMGRKSPTAGSLPIILCTCDLRKGVTTAQTLASAAESNGTVTYPELPLMEGADATPGLLVVTMQDTSGAYKDWMSCHMPEGIYMFDGSKPEIMAGVNAVRSLGIESAIVGAYQIPREYIYDDETETTADGLILSLAVKGARHAMDDPSGKMHYVYADVKNKKTCALYNSYVLASHSSGSTCAYDAHDLYYDGNEYPTFLRFSDPSSTGSPIMQPEWYERAPTIPYEQAVAGLPWLTASVFYGTSSGSAFTYANAGRVQRKLDMERNMQQVDVGMRGLQATSDFAFDAAAKASAMVPGVSIVTNGLTGTIQGGAVTGGRGGVLGLAQSGVDYGLEMGRLAIESGNINRRTEMHMGDNLFQAARSTMAAPEIAFPVSVNASAYLGNVYTVSHITLGDNDVRRFDDFLTKYGYACDKALEASDLNNRSKFNYLKTRDCHIKSATAPRSLCEGIEDMLNAGVRIWHVAPSQSAYESNTIRGGA